MKKASEYRDHSRESRALAAGMESAEQRAQLLRMAEHWDRLAEDREALIRKHPELAQDGEQDEMLSRLSKRRDAQPSSGKDGSLPRRTPRG